MSEIAFSATMGDQGSPGEDARFGQSFALFACVFAGGSIVGPILGGFIINAYGWQVMTLVLAILTASAGVIVASFMKI